MMLFVLQVAKKTGDDNLGVHFQGLSRMPQVKQVPAFFALVERTQFGPK